MTPDNADSERIAANRDAKINLLLAMNALANLHLSDERRALEAERVQLVSERAHHEVECRRLETELKYERARCDFLRPLRRWPFARRLIRQIGEAAQAFRFWLTRSGK